MPAFWWHFLVSGRMSSLPLTRLTHTEWSWYDRLWSLPHCLSLLLFPQWTSAYVDPHPPWKSRTKIHEMRCQILLSLWHGGEKKKNLWQRKDKKRRRSRPNYWPWWEVCEFSSPLMGMLIFLQYNMVRHSQSVGTKCGLGPKLHPGGTLPFKKWIGNCCKKSQKNSGCVTNRRQTGCGEGRRRRNPKSIGVGRCQGDQDWWVLPLGL